MGSLYRPGNLCPGLCPRAANQARFPAKGSRREKRKPLGKHGVYQGESDRAHDPQSGALPGCATPRGER
jgi:hypothetical protein